VTLDNPDATLEQSARLYLAQQAMLQKHQAEAITINCLGGFYGGHLKAYPCLGFVELLDTGLVGACEADLLSSITMIAMKHLVGRPGYISDPVMDTSKRQIIYAHCVATTKPFGPSGPSNPFEILTHAEDRKGAAVRSFLPSGYMTTTLEIHPGRREILCHRAKAVENVVMDRACRTKLAGEVVGDVEKLFTYWDLYGWHRVTFYGDLREPVRELAKALKLRFVEEA
jgi:L-fucose isomerase-like protein